jgi:nitrogen regulatory protein PII
LEDREVPLVELTMSKTMMMSFLVKMKLEVIVEDDDADKVTDAIKKAAYSGKIGDGKIFIYSIDEVIRIRTGEKDSDAV